MLAAAVVHLQALAGGPLSGGLARALHAAWHERLARANPSLAADLDHNAQTQPFTLTDLFGPHTGRGAVQAGDQAWFRVTTLSTPLTTALLTQWLPAAAGDTLLLAGIPWAVLAYDTRPADHRWAGQDTYDALRRRAAAAPDTVWRLNFRSPTTFSAGRGSHLPFPLPDALLKSWLRRWNAFSGAAQAIPADPAWRGALRVSAYRLRTVPVRQGPKLTIGCVGSYSFRAAPELSPQQLLLINTLARYAFYCGSGHQTTQGLGLTALRAADREVPQP